MERQLNLIEYEPIKADIVYTPDEVAKSIIDWLQPSGICLDPCRGDGSFYRYLPAGADWCEIKDGKDFFDYDRQVDWIIGNPPYSIFENWLIHSFELAHEVAYILPTNKVFQRQIIMRRINEWGGAERNCSLWFWEHCRLSFRFQCRYIPFFERISRQNRVDIEG